jgi:Protein of unknown function (DUF1236)
LLSAGKRGLPSGETIMTKRTISFGATLAILALPLAVHAQSTGGTVGTDAATSTATRAATAKPQGAGGTVLSANQSARVHEYVIKERRPSVNVAEKVAVGTVLPTSIELYPLPAGLGVKGDYRYGVVNEHIVLVDAKTHKITQMIN